MNKKSVITDIFAFVVSFFLFTFNVKADTYTFTYTDTDFSLLDNLSAMQNTISLYNNGYFNTHDYAIIYRNYTAGSYRGVVYFVFYKNNNDYLTINNNYIYNNSAHSILCFVDNNFTELVSCPKSWGNSPIEEKIFPFYSTYNLSFYSSDTNTYVFNYSDKTNNIIASVDTYYPTLYQSYNYFNQDDTPLLSSFVTLVVEKLAYMCEFFTSSYIYLSMFVIFILYFVIFLFRRVKNV